MFCPPPPLYGLKILKSCTDKGSCVKTLCKSYCTALQHAHINPLHTVIEKPRVEFGLEGWMHLGRGVKIDF